MNLFAEHSDIENRLMNTQVGEEEETGMNGESNMETYALLLQNRQPNGNLLLWPKELKLASVII